MAQPVPRKTVPWKGNAEYTLVDFNERAEENAQWHGSQDLIFLTDEVEGEEGDDEDENDEEEAVENEHDNEPTSCVGHFDRLDVEYAPKPTKQARAYVFYDENLVASWSGTPLLQQNEFSQRWDAMVADRKRASELGLLEDSSETEGRRSPRQSQPPTTSPPHSPMQVLKRLRASRTAVHRPEYEDPFFAGRLASTSVIMVHDGQPTEAERLGRWSVDLVGQKAWDKMVEMYGLGSRLETDDKNWMSSMLDDVHTWLRPIDDERAAELRRMILEWQDMDILPEIQGGQ